MGDNRARVVSTGGVSPWTTVAEARALRDELLERRPDCMHVISVACHRRVTRVSTPCECEPVDRWRCPHCEGSGIEPPPNVERAQLAALGNTTGPARVGTDEEEG